MLTRSNCFRLAPFALFGTLASACSDPEPAIAKVFASAIVTSGNTVGVNDSSICQLQNERLFSVGTEADPVSDGTSVAGAGVGIECIVAPSGDGFSVTATVRVQGKGSVFFQGELTKTGVQTGLHATFATDDIGVFDATGAKTCTFTYTPLANTPDNPPIAAGRIWGTLACEEITNNSQSPDRVCRGTSQIRLENCAQSK